MTAEAMQADAMFAALVEAIHDPNADADTCALAWSDALQEAGDDDRAEFVRVQVYLSSGDIATAGDAVRARRQIELLTAHEHEWRRAGKCPECNGDGGFYRQTAPGGHPLRKCLACSGTGDRGGLLRTMVGSIEGDDGNTYSHRTSRLLHRVGWRRGVPDRVECTLAEAFERVSATGCAACRGAGFIDGLQYAHERCPECDGGVWQPTVWASAVATGHPTLTGLTLTDREPITVAPPVDPRFPPYRWMIDDGSGGRSMLPEPIFCAIPEHPKSSRGASSWGRFFDTREAALEALGRAALKVCRAAGSPGA